MKCYYTKNDEWVEGEIINTLDKNEVHFYGKDGRQTFVIHKAEVKFLNTTFVVTGFRESTKDVFERVSVMVRVNPMETEDEEGSC